MRTISASLLTSQQVAKRTPYIKMLFTDKAGTTTKDFSTDSSAFGNRILGIDHQEEAYNEYALVTLNDSDNTIPDITGYWTEIGYGSTTLTSPYKEYLGAQTPRLWVKHQRHITVGGKLQTVLELEGMWTKLIEALLRMGTAPYYLTNYDGSTDTVYAVLLALFKEVFGGTNPLAATPPDDGIITTLQPVFTVNSVPFEYAAGTIYRALNYTKEFIRNQWASSYPESAFKCIYPQAADSADETYYSNPNLTNQSGFYSFMERKPTLVPNHVFMFYGRNSDGSWPTPALYGEAVSQADIDKYEDSYHIAIAPDVTTEAMADKLAEAIIIRARAEQDTGLAVVPHDGRVELYDKIAVIDNRGGGTTYPTHNLTRVAGLHHIYKPGTYKLEIYLGGVSNTSMDKYTADTVIMGMEINGQKVIAPKIETPKIPLPTVSDGGRVTGDSPRTIQTGPPDLRPTMSPIGPATSAPDSSQWHADIRPAPTPPILPDQWHGEVRPPSVPEPPKEENALSELISDIWQTVTPWAENKGETFGGEVSKRWESFKRWTGWFGGGK